MKRIFPPYLLALCVSSSLSLFIGSTFTAKSEIIAHSIDEFAKGEGVDGWCYGYVTIENDEARESYNADTDFIAFTEPDWTWTGTAWDKTNGNPPWTEISATGGHPDGTNQTEEFFATRRWKAEVDSFTVVAMMMHLHKNNVNCGNGTSIALHINGERVYLGSVESDDGVGIDATYYTALVPGDVVDFSLTSEGPDGAHADGCDGSSYSIVIDTDIPDNPVQPDGEPFVPPSAEDSDNDGLLDGWERLYFPDDLTQLSANGDLDGDGLTDGEEQVARTNPTLADTDGDGLPDGQEIALGTRPTSADTDGDGLSDGEEVNGEPATDPKSADTDGDGFDDGEEIAGGFDPNDPDSNPFQTLIADSVAEFSGVQGQDNWFNGYRNLGEFPAEAPVNYDPDQDFIPYPDDWWTGNSWDEPNADGDNVPWTTQAADSAHPNGTNSTDGSVQPGNREEWAIRRWVANSLTEIKPLGLWFHLRSTNTGCGNGTTIQLHINGEMVWAEAVEGNDGEGVTGIYYANVKPGDFIDLALTPVGPDGGRADGCDGSGFWLRIDGFVPEGATQPDGAVFEPFVPGDPHLQVPFASPFGKLDGAAGPQTRMVEVKNLGKTNMLSISAGAITGAQADHYSLDAAFPIELAPGAASNLSVTFDARGLDGGFAAALELTSNDENETVRSIDLSASIPDPNQLLGWYKLDDANASQLFDSSGAGNHGTYIVNGDATVDYSAAALASGTSAGLDQGSGSAYGEVPGFSAVEAMTISMWIQVDETAAGVMGLLSKSSGDIGNPYALAIQDGALIWFGGGVQDIITDPPVITDSEPHHVAVTYIPGEGGVTVVIYVDGVAVLTEASATPFTDSAATLTLGAVVTPAATFGFQGVIDEVQIYGRGLEAESVQWLESHPGQKLGGVTVDPGPSPVTGVTIVRLDTGNTLGWVSVAGGRYQVSFSPDLTPGSWVDLGEVDSGGATTELLHTGGEAFPTGFYRIALVTP